MVRSKIALVPALLAMALYGAGAAYAGDGKNGEGGANGGVDSGGGDGGGKNGGDNGGGSGGDGGGKNGGGDNGGGSGGNGGGKNGGGDNGGGSGGNGGGKNGGGNGGGKGGEPPPGPGPRPGPRPGANLPSAPLYGGGIGNKKIIVCVINGEVFRVRNIRDCASGYVQYRPVVQRKPRRIVRQVIQGGCGCSYGGGQDVVIGGFVGSPAAVKQARRRANAYGYYGGSYSGGYAYGGGYGYGEGQVIVRKKRIKRKARQVYYNPEYGYGYEPGVVLHTGPVIMKDGGY